MRKKGIGRKIMVSRKVAQWRLEIIEPALAVRKGKERRRAVKRICQRPVDHPTGEKGKVSRASVYRWLHAYEKGGGLLALEPRPRADRGKPRAPLPEAVITKALGFLTEDPEIPLPFLIGILSKDSEVASLLEEAGVAGISRSTLHRRLVRTEIYGRLSREKKRKRARRRWVPHRPHMIWYLDAKGPTLVTTMEGKPISFHILTVLEGASRAVLAAILAPTPDLAATVRVFRKAARAYGLPDQFYLDRASTFDTPAFRGGLGLLGIHRIFTKPRNPEVRGLIEAYHHAISIWFTRRLKKQEIVDLAHLEQLFEAVIEYYQTHRNRDIGTAPRDLLAGAVSNRSLPSGVVLDEAFLQPYGTLKAHPSTGEVDIGKGRGKHIAPGDLRGNRIDIFIDPDPELPVFARLPGTSELVRLERARVHPKDAEPCGPPAPASERWGRGVLQALHDSWRGKVRPIAEPGFGLPEIFSLFSGICGRPVPRTDAEASLVQRIYQAIGPFTRRAVEQALEAIEADIGRGRPLKTYLDLLVRRVVEHDPTRLARSPHSPKKRIQKP